MMVRHDEAAARTERARAIGLFRYQLIREAADPALSSKARGRLVRQIAAAEHLDPSGRCVRVSRDTLDRWIRAWRAGGFDALVPSPHQSSPRLPVVVGWPSIALGVAVSSRRCRSLANGTADDHRLSSAEMVSNCRR
jgi:putative transposase